MLFGHFCHHYHQNYHHNYHCNRHYHNWYFFCYTCKTSFLTAEKEVQVAPNGGRGGEGNLGNARKKTFFFKWGVPLIGLSGHKAKVQLQMLLQRLLYFLCVNSSKTLWWCFWGIVINQASKNRAYEIQMLCA